MSKFVEGKEYEWVERGLDTIKVIKRTPKSILVTNGSSSWMMRLRTDPLGENEYVVDSSVPKSLRGLYTCSSLWEI